MLDLYQGLEALPASPGGLLVLHKHAPQQISRPSNLILASVS